MNKKMKLGRNKGITLIALIITIVVLLILAAVTIRAVTGGNGILAHAKNARDKWEEEAANEEAMLGNLTNYITEQSGNGGETYVKVSKDTPASDNGTINGAAPNENNPIIPKGFIPIDTETSHWGEGNSAPDEDSVRNGLVIKDEDEDENGNANEFVWIPVSDISKMAKVTSGTDANKRQNYQGVLYDFTGTTATEKSSYGQNTTSYREPDNLSSDYDSTSNLSEWTNTLYQERFNAMVESVAKYKGFYVGRYEMSESGGKAQSKKGAESLQNKTVGYNWYGLYSKAKTYAAADSSVTSEMIWGCQYDAMMRWMQENGIDVTKTAEEGITDTGRQNATGKVDKTVTKNTGSKTGDTENGGAGDRLNNVYDLLGNRIEWTQEAFDTGTRVRRGGNYNASMSPSSRYGSHPTYTDSVGSFGSRLSLYIK